MDNLTVLISFLATYCSAVVAVFAIACLTKLFRNLTA